MHRWQARQSFLGVLFLIGWMWTSPGWGEGELIYLKLKDGSEAQIRHTETREEGIAGKIGAVVLHFPRERIVSLRVPAVDKALEEADRLLEEASRIPFSQLPAFESRLGDSIRNLRDLSKRLKWVAPEVDPYLPKLESERTRVRNILENSKQAEIRVVQLSDLSKRAGESENWNRTLQDLKRLIAEIPFQDRQDDLRKKMDSAILRRGYTLAKEKEPFFVKLRSLDRDRVSAEEFSELSNLMVEIEDPRLQDEAVIALDHIRMHQPRNSESENRLTAVSSPKNNPADRPAPDPTRPPSETERTRGTRFDFGTLPRPDPKTVGGLAGLLVLSLIVGRSFRGRNKVETFLGEPATSVPVERNLETERPSSRDTSVEVFEEPQGDLSMAAPSDEDERGSEDNPPDVQQGAPDRGETRREDTTLLERSPEEPKPEVAGRNPIDASPEENEVAEDSNENQVEPVQRGAGEFQEPASEEDEPDEIEEPSELLVREELGSALGMSGATFDSLAEEGTESAECGPETSNGQSSDCPPDRLVMEDLFEAFEKSIEPQRFQTSDLLDRHEERDERVGDAGPPSQSDGCGLSETLKEPEVSLEGVLGFEPDIGAFVENEESTGHREAPSSSVPSASEETEDSCPNDTENEPGDRDSVADCKGEEDSGRIPVLEEGSASGNGLDRQDPKRGEDSREDRDPATEKEEEIICPVTGIFTRAFFDRQFPKAFERCRRERYPLTLVLLRINHLEDALDEMPTSVREKTLVSIADSLRKSVRTRDILARFEEYSFAILMPQVKPTAAFPMALKIRNNLKKLHLVTHSGRPLELTVSFGMNCLREDDLHSTRQDLLAGCLESLEKASEKGGNHIVLYGIEGDSLL